MEKQLKGTVEIIATTVIRLYTDGTKEYGARAQADHIAVDGDRTVIGKSPESQFEAYAVAAVDACEFIIDGPNIVATKLVAAIAAQAEGKTPVDA